MHRILIFLGICFFISGCSSPNSRVHRRMKPLPTLTHFIENQDTAARPWVDVIPTKRTINYRKVDFEKIAHQIRNEIGLYPENTKFKKVGTITLDYTALPAEPQKGGVLFKEGNLTFVHYDAMKEHYSLTIKIYNKDQHPSFDDPLVSGTAVMKIEKAPPYEAISMMARELLTDLATTKTKVVNLNLN